MLKKLTKNKKEIETQNSYGRMAVRDRFIDLQTLVKTNSPFIIECGASSGPIIEHYLKLFKDPKIIAIEPQPEFVRILTTKFSGNKNIQIIDKAVGAENKFLDFNILNRPTSSSFFKPSSINHKYHPEEMDIKETIQIEQVKLDDLIHEKEVDIIKLDLQGYELEALNGAEQVLQITKAITTEIEFVSLYENQPLFGDIDVFLRKHGFYLYNLYELFTQNDGQLTAGDAVYLNAKYF